MESDKVDSVVARYLAELAWARYQRGEQDDPTSLSPIYLHHPKIGGESSQK